MSTVSPHRFLRALLRQPVDRTPIWIMRQAGRYLPEYRAVRQQAGDFLTLCKTPELACEVTLQPLRRFKLDAAIVFSDILTIPDAMGLGLHFVEGEGPQFERPVQTRKAIAALTIPDPHQELRYVCEAVALCRRELNNQVPLIGFAGSPWTLACYIVEGKSSREFRTIKTWLYQDPEAVHQLLDRLTEATILYLNAQIAAGAQAIMLFDTWGGLLTPHTYQTFSLAYMQRILDGMTLSTAQTKVPTILFTKGGGGWLENIAQSGCDAVGLDWTIDLGQARQRIGHQVSLQGNMDPAVLYGSATEIRQEVATLLNAYGSGTGHIFNLGHGVTQYTDPEKVQVLVDAVQELSLPFHAMCND